MLDTQFVVLLQQKVGEDFLGRVFSVVGMIQSIMMPLAMLVYGPLADWIRMEWLLMGAGMLLVIQSLFMLSNKVLIEAGKEQISKPEQ